MMTNLDALIPFSGVSSAGMSFSRSRPTYTHESPMTGMVCRAAMVAAVVPAVPVEKLRASWVDSTPSLRLMHRGLHLVSACSSRGPPKS